MRTYILVLLIVLCSLGMYAQDQKLAGSAACIECHEEIGEFTRKEAHQNPMFLGEEGRGCEACHGSGSEHVENVDPAKILGGDVLSGWQNEKKSKACLSCHKENLHEWSFSLHEADLSCWDCHGEMLHFQAPEKQKRAACAECNNDVAIRTKLQYVHNVSCEECHNPHGEKERGADNSALCLSCHSEYQGPYVFEHGALDDGCQACHDPHGSFSARLLKMTGNGLCLQCHVQSNFPASGKKVHSTQLSAGAFCYDCHPDVHGSNTDPSLIRWLR